MVFHGRIDKPVVNRCLTLYFAPLKSNMEPPEKLAFAMICVLGKHMQWMYGMTENVSNLFIQMPIYPAICPNPGPAQ